MQDNSNNVINFQQKKSNNHQDNEPKECADALFQYFAVCSILISTNRRTSSTETIIVPETQGNDRMNSFLVKSLSQQKQKKKEHKHKDNSIKKKQKDGIDYKQKINTTTKINEMRKSESTTTK